MTENTLIEIITKTGMGVGAFVLLCLISYSIIKHILTQSNKIMDIALRMNGDWQKVIDEHTANAKEFHNTSLRAFEHIRQEHKDLEGHQRELGELLRTLTVTLSLVTEGLKETEKALQKLNDSLLKNELHLS